MGEKTSISWTHATFNPWWGCRRISPACDDCYAASFAHRLGLNIWDNGQYRTFGAAHWAKPIQWNRAATEKGERRRVFCASMADVFDLDAPQDARANLWDLIEDTTSIDWLLLTKRIGNVLKLIPPRWNGAMPANVWLGSTVVTQAEVDRDVAKLLKVPAHIHFLSCEPLLEKIDLSQHLWGRAEPCAHCPCDIDCDCGFYRRNELANEPTIDWVIAGGESGRKARAMHPTWVREIRDVCVLANVPFHFKQWGQFLPAEDPKAHHYAIGEQMCVHEWDDSGFGYSIRVRSPKEAGRELDGRIWDEFPRVRAVTT